ncbi:MAG: hypothetical protein LBM06_02145 [Prevotellaceae bacterium]|jgi:V/A-type H+-transporting ATPase subunit E|nr:hypothetical protein [Prevotellaceae bacterium]
MENKIQALTEKIYREGVEKGHTQAQQIVAQAQEQALRIVEEARKEAAALTAAAGKEAEELRENTQSELKLFAAQAVGALRSEIASLITDRIVRADVEAFVADKNYLNAFIVALASKWSTTEPIVISTADADKLTAYFTARAKALLDGGVKIEQVNGQPALFTVQPADGAYKVQFGEDEFMNYFKEFLRPQLVKMLFS